MSRGRVPGAALALLTAALPAFAAAQPSVTAVKASIRRDGAKATVDALLKSQAWWGVETRIGSGDSRWVALASELAPGTDAATSEGLGIALAYALPRNPRAVLAVIDLSDKDGPVGVDRACGVPFIEDTVKDIPAYRRRAVRAVGAVHASALAAARAACLSALRRH